MFRFDGLPARATLRLRFSLIAALLATTLASAAEPRRIVINRDAPSNETISEHTIIETADGRRLRYTPVTSKALTPSDGTPFHCWDLLCYDLLGIYGGGYADLTDGGMGAIVNLDGTTNSIVSRFRRGTSVQFAQTFSRNTPACGESYYWNAGYGSYYCFGPGFIEVWDTYPFGGTAGQWDWQLLGDSTVITSIAFEMRPATIEKVQGEGAIGVINRDLRTRLVVRLKASDGRPVDGVAANDRIRNFTATIAGPDGSSGASVVADGPGRPQRDGTTRFKVTLGNTAGVYQVTVTHLDAGAGSVVFNVTAQDRLPPEDNPEDEEESGPEDCIAQVGDPINVTTGNVSEIETDFRQAGISPLEFVRSYNSLGSKSRLTGTLWQTSYDRFVIPATVAGTPVRLRRPDGRTIRFVTDTNGLLVPQPHFKSKLEPFGTGWKFTDVDLTVEEFDSTGRLNRIVDAAGRVTTPDYDSSGLMTSISSNAGGFMTFSYSAARQLTHVTDPAGGIWNYTYDGFANLTKVTTPSGRILEYFYQDSGNSYLLTRTTVSSLTEGGLSETGNWGYDEFGRATVNYVSRPALTFLKRFDIVYSADGLSRTVIDGNGEMTRYEVATQNNRTYVKSVLGPEYAACGVGDVELAFDATPNVTSSTQFGKRTEYGSYDAKGQPSFRIEAAGTASARRTDYEYDPRFFGKATRVTQPSVVAGQSKVTQIAYNAQGNAISVATAGHNPLGGSISRVETYRYDGPFAQLSEVDGPRTDVIDITRLTYDLTTKKLQSVVDANGVSVRSNILWNNLGLVMSEDRPNGHRVIYSYAAGSDLLESITETGPLTLRRTSWTYTNAQKVKTIRFSDGVRSDQLVEFNYRMDGELNWVKSGENSIEFVRDPMGNVISQRSPLGGAVSSPGTRWIDQTFDSYSRVDKLVRPFGTIDYDFWVDGSLRQVTDGRLGATTYAYDDFKRLTQVVQPGAIQTDFEYDVAGRLTKVVDDNTGTTTHTYDDLGNLVRVISPDSGTSVAQYDAAGNVVRVTDAKNQRSDFVYDRAGRLLSVDRAGSADDETRTYDTCLIGLTRLCSIAVSNGETVTFEYDGVGRLAAVIANNVRVGYTYDGSDRLVEIRYPSGRQVTYIRDASGRTVEVRVLEGTISTILARDVQYAAGGPATSWRLGNGRVVTRDFDQGFLPKSINVYQVSAIAYSSYDADGNLLRQSRDGVVDQFTYSAVDRLATASGTFGTRAYGYDGVGNRLSMSSSVGSQIYRYAPESNRLQGDSTFTYLTDPNGNRTERRTGDGAGNLYSYSSRNRLESVGDLASGNLRATYSYNGLGQRMSKTVAGATTRFAYGLTPYLLAEMTASGTTLSEYVYLDGAPLARLGPIVPVRPPPPIDTTGMPYHYFIDDSLGTPVELMDSNGIVVWKATYDPFGAATVNDDADGDGNRLTVNLRFPGQYFDAESGLHYNYLRDYDPATGRYIQSDPIGLAGGINTYAYVGGNPISFFDPSGLCPCGTPAGVISAARSDNRDWSTNADRTDVNAGFGEGTYKCNLYADTQYEKVGYNLPNIGGSAISRILGRYPPGAQSLSNPNYSVPGWPVVSGPARAGDLLAEGGHVGIATGPRTTISASPGGVVENAWGFRPDQAPVIRRCACP